MRSRRLAVLRSVSGATIPTGRSALLLAALLGSLSLACAESDPTAPEQPSLARASTAANLARCSPLPQATRRQVVSPGAWDTLKVGPHRLIFQPGSLKRETVITASVSDEGVRAIRFEPEGLKFRNGHLPILEMNVGGCSGVTNGMHIVYVTDNLRRVKETLSSIADPQRAKVSAPLRHFSRYAVHY